MNEIDRRVALRSMLGGVIAAGLGASLLARPAEALPLALDKDLAAKADDARPPVHEVDVRRRRPPPRPLPPPRRHWHRRRRWVCWWHRGRRHCGWRW